MAMAILKRCVRMPILLGVGFLAGCESDVTDPSAARPGRPQFVLLAPGTVAQVSAGHEHSCALKTDGTVVCWGASGYGQATPPAGTFTQVTAGDSHTCGIRSDSTVACWGDNLNGQATPPVAGTFPQASDGDDHSRGT